MDVKDLKDSTIFSIDSHRCFIDFHSFLLIFSSISIDSGHSLYAFEAPTRGACARIRFQTRQARLILQGVLRGAHLQVQTLSLHFRMAFKVCSRPQTSLFIIV